MDEYKANSHRAKTKEIPDKKIEKVISGKVRTKKKNKMDEIKDVFISEDVNNVKSYILIDVLIPAIKKAISDIVRNGIDMILYGEKKGSTSSKISYRSYYDKDRDRNDYTRSRTTGSSRYDHEDIILDSKGEAEEVLCRMDELISMYGVVSIADLNDLVGKDGNYTDNKYGWTDLRTATTPRVREGYLLKLPRALPLN